MSPLDVGCHVLVDIIPMAEEGEQGIASVDFGPVHLDPGMKKTLQGIIRAGGTKFVVDSMKLVSSGFDMRSSINSRTSGYHSSQGGEVPGNFVLYKNNFKIVREAN